MSPFGYIIKWPRYILICPLSWLPSSQAKTFFSSLHNNRLFYFDSPDVMHTTPQFHNAVAMWSIKSFFSFLGNAISSFAARGANSAVYKTPGFVNPNPLTALDALDLETLRQSFTIQEMRFIALYFGTCLPRLGGSQYKPDRTKEKELFPHSNPISSPLSHYASSLYSEFLLLAEMLQTKWRQTSFFSGRSAPFFGSPNHSVCIDPRLKNALDAIT